MGKHVKFGVLFLGSCLILFLVSFLVNAVNDMQCIFVSGTSCPANNVKLIGVENDTEGYNNAHVQNYSLNTYAYSVCCNNTNSSINITNSCSGADTIVIRFNNGSNAHVEVGTNTNYTNTSCLSSDWKKVYCSYPTSSCPAGKACILTMSSTEGDNRSNAHVGNCSAYTQRVCCGLDNTEPTKPVLDYPSDDNETVFERKPNFNWTASTDTEGNEIDYTINISCGVSCPGSCLDINVGDITDTNYSATSALCVDVSYNWSVTVCDVYDACNTSTTYNFTIKSLQDIIFIYNETSFGSLSLNQNDDTSDDSPQPLVARNIGNVLINASINATSLFNAVGMNTIYYQFRADENETGSYEVGCSQTTYTPMDASLKMLFCNMSYEDANDEGELELSITVPPSESPGAKTSRILISTIAIEP